MFQKFKVKIINPMIFVRCGYPMDVRDVANSFSEEQQKKVEDFIRDFFKINSLDPMNYATGSIMDNLAYIKCCMNGFGGNERKIYEEEYPVYKDKIVDVIGQRTVLTGIRTPGGISAGYCCEPEFDSPCLEKIKRNILYKVKINSTKMEIRKEYCQKEKI